jgi:hypothetical protein
VIAPVDNTFAVVATAFVFTVAVAFLKLLTFKEVRNVFETTEALAEFPIDASAAYFSLALGVLVLGGRSIEVNLLNFNIIFGILGMQLYLLKVVRANVLEVKEAVVWLKIVLGLTFNWISLFISTLTIYAIFSQGSGS